MSKPDYDSDGYSSDGESEHHAPDGGWDADYSEDESPYLSFIFEVDIEEPPVFPEYPVIPVEESLMEMHCGYSDFVGECVFDGYIEEYISDEDFGEAPDAFSDAGGESSEDGSGCDA